MASDDGTLIAAEWIVTQDANRRVITNGAVFIQDGAIVAAGPRAEVEREHPCPGTVLDLGESCVLPGLVNAHTHASMTMFRGLADDLPLQEWLTTRIWPVEAELTRELVYLGSLLACAEMSRTGTTCFADMYLFEEDAARAVLESGMRAVLAEGVLDVPTKSYSTPEEAFEVIESQMERFKGESRLSFAVAVHAVYTSSRQTLIDSFKLAEKHNVPWMIHVAENAMETAQCLESLGMRPLACLSEAGVLGERSLLSHCVDLTGDEIANIAQSGAMVNHNPESNMKLASGRAPIPEMLAAGMPVCLGTDGAASNNNLNMFTEMTSCALLHKGGEADATVAPASAVLDMATRHGALALRLEGVGAIEPGKRADLIALDMREPNLTPVYDPTSHLVYAANGGETRLSMVDGHIVYLEGEYKTIDYPALRREVREVARWVRERIS